MCTSSEQSSTTSAVVATVRRVRRGARRRSRHRSARAGGERVPAYDSLSSLSLWKRRVGRAPAGYLRLGLRVASPNGIAPRAYTPRRTDTPYIVTRADRIRSISRDQKRVPVAQGTSSSSMPRKASASSHASKATISSSLLEHRGRWLQVSRRRPARRVRHREGPQGRRGAERPRNLRFRATPRRALARRVHGIGAARRLRRLSCWPASGAGPRGDRRHPAMRARCRPRRPRSVRSACRLRLRPRRFSWPRDLPLRPERGPECRRFRPRARIPPGLRREAARSDEAHLRVVEAQPPSAMTVQSSVIPRAPPRAVQRR